MPARSPRLLSETALSRPSRPGAVPGGKQAKYQQSNSARAPAFADETAASDSRRRRAARRTRGRLQRTHESPRSTQQLPRPQLRIHPARRRLDQAPRRQHQPRSRGRLHQQVAADNLLRHRRAVRRRRPTCSSRPCFDVVKSSIYANYDDVEVRASPSPQTLGRHRRPQLQSHLRRAAPSSNGARCGLAPKRRLSVTN
jgi:hypothetical protein